MIKKINNTKFHPDISGQIRGKNGQPYSGMFKPQTPSPKLQIPNHKQGNLPSLFPEHLQWWTFNYADTVCQTNDDNQQSNSGE